MTLKELFGRERRRSVRVTAEVPLKIYYRGRAMKFPGAFTRDISTGGLGVELKAKYADMGTQLAAYRGTLEIEMELGSDAEPITVIADVRWVARSRQRKGGVQMGLKFVEIADADRRKLSDFLKGLVDRQYHEKIVDCYESARVQGSPATVRH